MECKGYLPGRQRWQGAQDLIETLWNVKRQADPPEVLPVPDLIETLWNVKECASAQCESRQCDLIETLWNVKFL